MSPRSAYLEEEVYIFTQMMFATFFFSSEARAHTKRVSVYEQVVYVLNSIPQQAVPGPLFSLAILHTFCFVTIRPQM